MSIETTMPEKVFKPEAKQVNFPSGSSDEFLHELELADVYLPVATEFSPVGPESRVVVHSDPRSAGADRFRLMKMRLQSFQSTKKLKTLLVTSPLPGDGKTTVALNLATALSEKGRRPVMLLEADVYRPTLCKRLGLKPWLALTECFENRRDPLQAIRRIDPLGIYLLPAGSPIDDGQGLLQSGFMSQLLTGLATTSFDWVLVDSPPTTPVAEILALRELCDAVLLVARSGVTPREAIEESIQNLGREHIHGIVLNEVEGLDRIYSRYYGYYTKTEDGANPSKSKGTSGLGLK